jgi:competence protein ComEC
MDPLEMIFWDVQHGNATYIKTPSKKHIALDLGTGSYGSGNDFSPLLLLKNKWNIQRLDEVIITHPHTDHIADILNLKEKEREPRVLWRPKHLTEDEIWDANRSEDEEIIDKYIDINNRYSHPVKPEENPTNPQNNGGVRFYGFVDKSNSKTNINNHGLVVVVEYLGVKVLFPGDIEPPAWSALLERDDFVSAIRGVDILVASHHGRDSGFYNDIFNHFTPKLTIISDGRFCDTSATSRYSQKTPGWMVTSRKDESNETRKCVTTRNDGAIVVSMGELKAGNNYIYVTVA